LNATLESLDVETGTVADENEIPEVDVCTKELGALVTRNPWLSPYSISVGIAPA
jgi:hypothetical protein